ncbi:FHA domain-containing protein [Gymnodinialimonas ulvae]|uniref:FHA domain-containing protein n=1 Tax=Gymnodinialimonas ulvae TaxID=3126504 RepID=UPI00309E7C35
MSINRLRNVAVRMRPPRSTDGPAPEATPDVEPPALPRRIVVSRPEPDQKRQIWDLEDDAPAGAAPSPLPHVAAAPVAAPAPAPPAAATPPVAATVTPPAPLADAAPSRAKTRIIGFHAEDVTADPAGAAAKGPVYPAGFLVVIDGPGRGAHFIVTTHVSTIGRGTDQDVSLDFGDESISRSGHASVMYDPEQNCFFLGHGNKANAVRRNGMPVLATEKLDHGDDIRIGKTTLRFHAFCGADFTWGDADDA